MKTASEATITRPAYFRLYRRICGMTGTAAGSRERAATASYGLPTEVIPLQPPFAARAAARPRLRHSRRQARRGGPRNRGTASDRGQPVLVGTRTIENSEALAEALAPLGLPFPLLNAKQDAEEAAHRRAWRVSPARSPSRRIWPAAGRTFRCRRNQPRLGGLHVIGIERHESARIDRQLIGRGARQGQPGSAQFFLSLEDDLLVRHAPAVTARISLPQRISTASFPAAPPRISCALSAKSNAPTAITATPLARNDEWVDELKQTL